MHKLRETLRERQNPSVHGIHTVVPRTNVNWRPTGLLIVQFETSYFLYEESERVEPRQQDSFHDFLHRLFLESKEKDTHIK